MKSLLLEELSISSSIPQTFVSTNSKTTSNPSAKRFSLDVPKKYVKCKKIGYGSYGTTYEVISEEDNTKYAAKFSSKSLAELTMDFTLENEALILKKVEDEVGFPHFKELTKEMLVMTLLGDNLQTLLEKHGRFSVKTILMLGIQCIQRIEKLHKLGYLHRDIKPENFVIGFNERDYDLIHLIDFGLAKPYLTENKKHIKFTNDSRVGGTLLYLSMNGHLGFEASRRDDLYSLGYMLIHLFNGSLPWTNVKGDFEEKKAMIYKTKVTTHFDKLCAGLPDGMVEYFECVHKMAFLEDPDYNYLIGLFEKMMREKGFENDGAFDWNKKKIHMGINLNARKLTNQPLKRYEKSINETIFDCDL